LKKNAILPDIPLFAELSTEQQQLIVAKAKVVEYKKGEFIYQEGSAADAFYCVILGRVLIYTTDPSGSEKILEYLHRGKYFGIISLLTGEPHSVTARAFNDTQVLKIAKDDFATLLKEIPSLAIDLSRTLSRRLKNKDLHQKTIFESTVVSVFSSYSQAGKTVYALNLALSLKKETFKSVLILEICPKDKEHSLYYKLQLDKEPLVMDSSSQGMQSIEDFISQGRLGVDLICFRYDPPDTSSLKKLVAVLTVVVNDYHYIILDLPATMDEFVIRALNQSDTVHLLTSPEPVDLKRTRHLIERLKRDFAFPAAKIKIIINEYKFAKLSYEEETVFLGHPIFATLPKVEFAKEEDIVIEDPDCEYAKVTRRISREVGECQVGLALGVGVGYGFCHIGVLRVIEQEDIPIDVISGASIGAIIAALWVTGRSSGEILQIISQEFKERKYVWKLVDLTFSAIGFLKGNRFYNFLKRYFGNKTFQDIRLPLKIIASDIRKKEPRILEEGMLTDALMASCTMPGIFHPFRLKGEMLFDGGIINPLPTEALFQAGAKKIIAVNVTPSREDILRQMQMMQEEITLSQQALKKRNWFDLKRYLRGKVKNNILDVVFSSIEVMQSELVQKEAELADIVLHPDTQGLHWMELHRAEEFTKRGEEETRRHLEQIWKMIKE
jgi:NTE family protein